MQPHCNPQNPTAICAAAVPACCPNCGDWLIAPVSSEFVEGIEIRHGWECDSCGEASSTSIPLSPDASGRAQIDGAPTPQQGIAL